MQDDTKDSGNCDVFGFSGMLRSFVTSLQDDTQKIVATVMNEMCWVFWDATIFCNKFATVMRSDLTCNKFAR